MSMGLVIQYALRFVGTPYIWGGDDPMRGFDCSGFVQELLLSGGAHPDPKTDHTAQMLYNHFEVHGSYGAFGPGALSFYGKDVSQITHVGFCLNEYVMIEAGGGGSKTMTLEDAVRQNAFIRMRPIRQRRDFLCVIKPRYAAIGML